MRLLVALAMAALVLMGSADAEAGKGKKKNAEGVVTGTVTGVNADKDGGTLTVKLRSPGEKNAGNAGQEKTFKLTSTTTVEKVSGKKANRQTTPAQITDLKVGEKVVLKANGEQAESIKIKGKKKKAA